jgi:hypothetical protein
MTNATVNTDRLKELDKMVLHSGGHSSFTAGHCAMEVVAYIAGEKRTDHPVCTCPVIAAFMRSWNDRISNDETRTRLLKPLLPLLVGTRSTKAVQTRRAWMAADWALRVRTPALLRMAKITELAEQLEQLPEIVSRETAEPARDIARKAREAAQQKRQESWATIKADAAAAAYAVAAYADAADAADAAADAAAAYAYAYAAADAPIFKQLVEAAKSGGYWAARKVADETIGKHIREQFADVADVIVQQQTSTQDLVRRMCAVTAESLAAT